MTTRVLIADDHAPARAALKVVLGRIAGVEVVAEAGDGAAAVRMAGEWAPDVVIMDIQMPRVNGIEATRQILTADPGARVIGVSLHADQPCVQALMAAGAKGYVLKERVVAHLNAALLAVLQGQTYLSPDLPPPMRAPHRTREGDALCD